MDRVPLIINAMDFSRLANKYGYAVGYVLKTGPNGGDMEDGTEVIDRRAVMTTITWQMNDMPSEDLGRLLNICLRDPLLSVYYFEPRTNAARTSIFTAEVGVSNILLYTAEGARWFKGPLLTLREVQSL